MRDPDADEAVFRPDDRPAGPSDASRPEAFESVLAELRRTRGVDFGLYRRPPLERRLAAYLVTIGDELSRYLDRLRADQAEADRLLDALAVNVSGFFRDPLVFETLEHVVVPEILAAKSAASSRDLRVWSAGCAAGEEAYSVAILLNDALAGDADRWTVHVFATDIDRAALAAASGARFPRSAFADTKLDVLDAHFVPDGDSYVVGPDVRARVWFSEDDLTSPRTIAPAASVFGAFDLVLCRNVLIYFATELQRVVLDKLHSALAPGGYLVLGLSESLDGLRERRFVSVDRRAGIYRKLR
jgi:chemotaxis methyl-accepting protein methylase